ncbi:MAG: lysine 2,3-aminomutase [Chlorobium sp.]|nr:lysine 2,3-aminomutase [Chlorobium sp.]MCW8814664.1 lysine 2,3-aminomutase [Chlorobium sp.]MCW8820544.1 lysine 2,3-aminomutase [Ignavibacteriaceae bacterium]
MLKYRSYTADNLHTLPQYGEIPEEQLHIVKTVATVYPFRVNSYVTEHLIDWSNIPEDPIFRLSFPQEEMLNPEDFQRMSGLVSADAPQEIIRQAAREIQLLQNPNPAGQMELNTPLLDDEALHGIQHKYRESVLFFPSEAQVCHAYCTYCFRWPQFSGLESLKFANNDITLLLDYLKEHPEVKDIIFTGGDPMVMSTALIRKYIQPLLDIPTVKTIRIGTKALSWWPYRFTAEHDSDELLSFFEQIVSSGKHLAIMAHISHPREIETSQAVDAINRIRSTGAVIRSQSPIVRHVNDDADIWESMWQKQLQLGIIPYYMFLERDTGPKQYFEIPLSEAVEIFNTAYQRMSGLGRTVRGPSMSCSPGKIIVQDVTEIHGEKVFALKFTQSRNPEWTNKIFFAEYDDDASWIDNLSPALGHDEFFFENEMERLYTYS